MYVARPQNSVKADAEKLPVPTDVRAALELAASLETTAGQQANLVGVHFREADLTGVTLAGANLQSADLRAADRGNDGRAPDGREPDGRAPANANLTDANLDLDERGLSGANLTGADLRSPSADRCGAAVRELYGCGLRDADLGANLGAAHLKGELTDANLRTWTCGERT